MENCLFVDTELQSLDPTPTANYQNMKIVRDKGDRRFFCDKMERSFLAHIILINW